MLTDRGLRRAKVSTRSSTNDGMLVDNHHSNVAMPPTGKKALKRKASASVGRRGAAAGEPNNNVKRPHLSIDSRDEMFAAYQPWVIQTYGDLAKTKTITLKKYARVLRTLRGDEIISADNSKFRFWVKAKGFHIGQPAGYEARPADTIVGRYSVCDADHCIPPVSEKLQGSAKDPPLYVPNASFKNTNGEAVHRKVAIVENFFDIIYNVHVELEGRPGKHAGQKRTYRTITETYAFLPREAVTRFLLGCTECQKHPRSPSPISVLPTPSPSPTLPSLIAPPTTAATTPTANIVAATILPSLPHATTAITIISSATPAVESSVPNSRTPDVEPPPHTPAPHRTATPVDPSHPSHPSPVAVSAAREESAEAGATDEETATLQQRQQNGEISQSHCKTVDPLTKSRTLEPRRSSNPLDVCNLLTTAADVPPPAKTPPKKRHLNHLSDQQPTSRRNGDAITSTPKLWSPVESIERERDEKNRRVGFMAGEIDYSMPITTTYLKYMRSLGCTDEDAFQFENKNENLSTPESSENNEEDHFGGTAIMKDSDKFKLMLLAWNYHNQAQGANNRNGTGEVPDLSSLAGSEEMAGLWAQYHALGLAKGGKATPPAPRDQSSPVNAETGSAHDETSSSGNKEDEDDDDDESDDKIDTQTHDPERLKAFNMFVRLFVDENLDRMVPISKQPKEKIQAIIDSCTRQFPEFAERARKRIRTYLKSCRRNKRARDPNSPWDATRPTPAHLTSVQAEQILASACENESHNAKRMRLGLEPVSQPMPLPPGSSATDTTASINRGLDFSSTPVKLETDAVSSVFPSSTTPSSTPNSISKGLALTPDIKTGALSVSSALGSSPMNGIGIASTAGSAAPTAMYRPNFSQAFQRAGPYPLFPGQSPFAANSGGLLSNGPADLSMKQKPLLNHKLSTGEMAAVRQLITGYRESAAFLLRSADELEQLLIQQQ